MRPTTRLRELIDSPGIVVAPGIYDGVSARLVERAGFECAYMTGGGTAATLLGQPDLGLTSLAEMVSHVHRLSSCISLPIIADADTGFGNPLNAVRTVREYEWAGVAGMHIEDQAFPKKCGHLASKTVVSPEEFEAKIRACAEHRLDQDFVLIARTDARGPNGLDDAIDRANRYARAGADMIFVEAPQSEDEIATIAEDVDAPLLINMAGANSLTPSMSAKELDDLGYKVVIFPAASLFPAVRAIEESLLELKATGMDPAGEDALSPMEFFSIVGIEWWQDIDQKFKV